MCLGLRHKFDGLPFFNKIGAPTIFKKDSSLFFFVSKLDLSILSQNSNFMLHKLSIIYFLKPMELIPMLQRFSVMPEYCV